MESRREPRLRVYTAAKATLIEDPQQEQECLVLDISSTGVKFVADQKLRPDDMIVLEVEDHLVLADVRYSEPRNDKYVVGAERIHALDKAALPADQAKAEQIQFLVDDYRARIRAAVTGPQPASKPGHAEPYRDQIVTAAVQELLRQWSRESEDSTPEGILRAAIVERSAR